MESTAVRLVFVTAPTDEVARDIARVLVSERLAACVNLVPGVTSVYRWEDAVQEDSEVLMVVKARADRIAELETRILELHPYDVPECVTVRPASVEARYLAWWLSATGATDGPDEPS